MLTAWKLLPNNLSLGRKDCERGLQDTVCVSSFVFQCVVFTTVKPEHVYSLIQELQTLLDKEVVEHVPIPDRESGCYSQYFLVPRNDRVLHPIFRSLQTNLLSKNVQVKNADRLGQKVTLFHESSRSHSDCIQLKPLVWANPQRHIRVMR